MTSPKVSVLLPAYNRADYLAEAIESALSQTFHDLELVIVDDGSTDNTAVVCKSFPDSRIRYYYQENRGVSAALNTAWHAALGEYLALLGSDDVWLPNLLAELVSALDAEPQLGLIYARARGMDSQGRELPQLLGAPPKFPGKALASLLYGDCVCGLAAVFRRECVEKVEGWQEDLIANEDWDIWIRMAEHCRYAYRDLILARYRIHSSSLTGGKSAQYERVILDRVRLIESYYARPAVPPEALAVKSIALRNVYMDVTIRLLSVGERRAAFPYFLRTLRSAPNPFLTALRVLGVGIFDLYLSKTQWGVRLVDTVVARRRGTDMPLKG